MQRNEVLQVVLEVIHGRSYGNVLLARAVCDFFNLLSFFSVTSFRVAAGISKGFVVANFLMKGLVLIHPTVTPDGHGARSVNRYMCIWVVPCTQNNRICVHGYPELLIL